MVGAAGWVWRGEGVICVSVIELVLDGNLTSVVRLSSPEPPYNRDPTQRPPRIHRACPFPSSSSPTSACANGLRLIVAEDHLAPVVAINIWYNVGSKHEVPGKTGFAHLFEHVMFQGSAHVGKAEHMALVQAAGGTLNGTTWLDRTNYYETMPSHQLELAIWLEADRMGTLLDALSQENLDNQREVVKNEKRWSYDNRPYGYVEREARSATCSRRTTRTTTRRSGRWRTSTRRRSTTSRRSSPPTTPPTTRCSRSSATSTGRRSARGPTATSGRIPANPSIPPLGDLSLPPLLGEELREVVEDSVPLPRIYFGFRAPAFGDPRLDALDLAGSC